MFLSRASDIITDSVIGVDQLHPPTAQHIRQDPNLPVELLPFLAPLGLRDPPGTSSGEGGIVIDTVADPRQRVSPNRTGSSSSPKILSLACLVTAAFRSCSTRAGRGRAPLFCRGVHVYNEIELTCSMQGPDNRLRPPQKCLSCQTTQTPEWRRGPYGARITSLHALLVLPPFSTMFPAPPLPGVAFCPRMSRILSETPPCSFAGPRTLCNACGLTYAKLVRDNNRVRL